MTINPAGTIAIQLHQARQRLAVSKARARRLAGLIERVGAEGAQGRALADAFAIAEDLIAQQRDSIAALESCEKALAAFGKASGPLQA
ncbi:hypothetical protein [Hansschlegelia zhihuaiae]|uniref:Uncharacterized protein n=1 Tax=Hansschlegelia zhihuaiae TaxID=405005 RepID=A0A4Q0MJJ9_9HYPH|nr:hypothetical protein [Hansschlegelia zhihuaiae]RXF73891.1 hypothetical protein EK403_07910 [Hansschlegelia zhihuaiae]